MDIISLLFYFIVIIPSAIIHEYAHGWMAYQLGDPTAKYAGRLTVDPRAHIDKWGTIILPIGLTVLNMITGGSFFFAYARPVPYNPYNLRDQKWGPALVAVAGPLSNILVAFVFGMMFRFAAISEVAASTAFLTLLVVVIYINILLAVFNLIPI